MIKAIVVDDEAPARRELRRLLGAYHQVNVVGEASDLATARGLALRTRPDVVFLDIRLGNASGFDLLPDLDSAMAIVFVTAYDSYAVAAFEQNALDYLVKPVDPQRLAISIERLERLLADRAPTGDRETRPFTGSRWLFLESEQGADFVEIATIARIDSDRRGSRITTANGQPIPTARSLEYWLRRLPRTDFHRVHRSTIVNLAQVERVEPWSHYSYRLHLRGIAAPVTMSRRQAARLREYFG